MDSEYYIDWDSLSSSTIDFYKADTSSVTLLHTESFIKSSTTVINSGNDPSGTSIVSAGYSFTFTPQLVSAGEFISFRIRPGLPVSGGEIGLGLFWY